MKKIKLYDVVLFVIIIGVVIFCISPILLMVISSFTDNMSLIKNGYSFFPEQWSLDAYVYLFKQRDTIFRAYMMTIIVAGTGTAVSVALTSLLSYALARKGLPGRKLLTFIVYFTMLFNGGLVPTYLMYTNTLHIKNTIFALIIPTFLLPAFNVMLMRSYLVTSIPNEIMEAASMDGASELKIFSKVVMPMSKPIVATVFLYQLINYWNDWQNGLYYVTTNTNLYTIQVLLNRMIMDIQYLSTAAASATTSTANIPSVAVRMAIAFIGIIPILLIYPFIQKYFTKGIVLGGVKG